MPKNKTLIGLAAIKRVMKDESRMSVSADAAQRMLAHIETYGQKIATKSVKLSEHTGRTTILSRDVLLAK